MEYILQTNGLTKVFGNKAAVNKVNLKVKKGDIYGFIGKNGAGKTTLIRMATGLAEPTEGQIELFGSKDLTAQRNKIGTVIEYPAIYPHLTALENMKVQCKLLNVKGDEIPRQILETVGLSDTGKKKAKNFSLGMKQRLAIALALAGDPEFLILDEPTNGLDPTGIKEIRELIQKLNKERGITVLISSHILGELSKLATRYGIIHQGRLIEEFTEDELQERCRTKLVVQVRPEEIEQVKEILEKELNVTKYKVRKPDKIRMEEYTDDPGEVNKVLANNDILVQSISVEQADLERYFIDTIGGVE